jgi:hypothetical protein
MKLHHQIEIEVVERSGTHYQFLGHLPAGL